MSQNTTKSRLPRKGWLALIAAVLVLAANFILMQIGKEPLPDAITDIAEEVVATSVQELQSDTDTDTPRATPTSTTQPTATPVMVVNSDATEEAESSADTVTGDGIWESTPAEGFDRYVLALSWEPAFCEIRSDKEECVTQSEDRFDAENFVLHGLWPDDGDRDYNDTSYCDVSQSQIGLDKDGDWCDLPALSLSQETREDLFTLMPGATSCLQNHEWTKHGTCSGLTVEAYYALANHLTTLFSQTAFNTYVADRIGTEVTRNELLNQFEKEFGPGSDQYLSLKCKEVSGTDMLTELYITIEPNIDASDGFSELFPDVTVSPQGSCPSNFWIDEVGIGN